MTPTPETLSILIEAWYHKHAGASGMADIAKPTLEKWAGMALALEQQAAADRAALAEAKRDLAWLVVFIMFQDPWDDNGDVREYWRIRHRWTTLEQPGEEQPREEPSEVPTDIVYWYKEQVESKKPPGTDK